MRILGIDPALARVGYADRHRSAQSLGSTAADPRPLAERSRGAIGSVGDRPEICGWIVRRCVRSCTRWEVLFLSLSTTHFKLCRPGGW